MDEETKKQLKQLKKRSNGLAIDLPHELGYQCPLCKEAGEGLDWSEYEGFIWCYDCKLDIPSCLCIRPTKLQIEIFIKTLSTYK